LRGAAQVRDLEVILLGSELEGPDFWRGIRTRRAQSGWLTEVAAVVQPALLEDKPQVPIAALAAGVPVIATEACGLGSHKLLTLIPAGDEAALQEALNEIVPVV
jgi:glycosyltransferase involved in cell wall biosynthesis